MAFQTGKEGKRGGSQTFVRIMQIIGEPVMLPA